MGVSARLLDQPLDDRTHDLGFLQADFQDFLMVDGRLRWVVNHLPFELNEDPKNGKQCFLRGAGKWVVPLPELRP